MNGHTPLSVSRHGGAGAVFVERRIAELVASGLLPQTGEAAERVDLVATCRAYVRFLREKPNDLQAQRTRLTRARADRAELELRRRAGELVEVRAALSKEIRQALEALADTLNSGGPIRMTSLSPLWRLSRIGRLGVHSMDTRGLDVFLAVRELWVSRQRPAAGGASPTRPPHHVET